MQRDARRHAVESDEARWSDDEVRHISKRWYCPPVRQQYRANAVSATARPLKPNHGREREARAPMG